MAIRENKLRLLMIVDDPDIALFASTHGVDRIMVDLETLGKQERQGHLDTVQSALQIEDVTRIRQGAPDAHLLVRINPLHEGSKDEVDAVVARGADAVMLPMFHNRDTLARFFDILADRVEALPLFETIGAVAQLPEMIGDLPLTGLHFGLNDLHLERGDAMMFEPLAQKVLDGPAKALRSADIPFGIGGIARSTEGVIPPEILLGEHVRLGSSGAILSRSFHRRARSLDELKAGMDFVAEIARLRKIYNGFLEMDTTAIAENTSRFRRAVEKVSTIRSVPT
ncbi:aldolase [Rhodophyticola sp. CCM32]|uniref:aldolase/citrate lyase family protein n=1 Tax=Rhodophyticola sp. CCM32 TaxID=2916397 RepID=UPI00107F8F74|nr:aldolase/citrate lyase family protein [Rhodophyticola sp. CCM32]QBY01298.1 aldolase [Rhodophyticola sp. CCM32]